MFRKEEALARDWTPEKSHELSSLQKELILQAADMLRPCLLYTSPGCTECAGGIRINAVSGAAETAEG